LVRPWTGFIAESVRDNPGWHDPMKGCFYCIEADALAAEKIQQWLEGKTVRKVIVVPGRLVNIAVS
jgi:hypothetical protein